MSRIKQLSADDFEKIIKEKNIHLLDVREKYDFESGHIKGAQLVPSSNFEEEFEKLKLGKKAKIALYDLTGSRSDFLAKKILQLGYENIYNLEMGLMEWKEFGKSLVK